MDIQIDRPHALRLVRHLLNSPKAPGNYSHFINVGTDHIIDALDQNYFRGELADGIGSFKYLEGGYGSGKTQFINSLAQRAREQDVVTAIVTVGVECPFNSPASIYAAIMESFCPPLGVDQDELGIEVLIDAWLDRRIRQLGAEPGADVPEVVQRQIDQQIGSLWKGAPDQQMAAALAALSRRLLKTNCGAMDAAGDSELVSWVRGGNVRSTGLKALGAFEPVRDENAFRRLKTVISFLRSRMGYRGFFIAFDEGTRTLSFRRGSAKQKQAIENLLTMINQNAEGEFGGVMFVYAATPEFRSEVITTYPALKDRIGTKAFSRGSPQVPLINVDEANSEEVIRSIGHRLLIVFSRAYGVSWNAETQNANMKALIAALWRKNYEKPTPRFFVYQYCRFLEAQRDGQSAISAEQADAFVAGHEPPEDAA